MVFVIVWGLWRKLVANILMSKLTVFGALDALARTGGDFARLIEKPSFDASLYRPLGTDPQEPHVRDELYVIASGSGNFVCDGQLHSFGSADVFYVPAGMTHRFMDFSDDFATWVIFFGPRASSDPKVEP
jgi:hypothetical protein